MKYKFDSHAIYFGTRYAPYRLLTLSYQHSIGLLIELNMRFPTIVVRGDVLTSWLTVSNYNRSRLARELGISKGRVSQLITSHQEPSVHLVAKLLLLTHLPFERLFTLLHDNPALPSSSPALALSSSQTRSGKTAYAHTLK